MREHQLHRRGLVVEGPHLGIPDVGAHARQHGGDGGEQAGPVLHLDVQADVVGGLPARFRLVPLHRDAALRVVEEVLHVGAALGVDGNPLAAGDVAHDGLTHDRVAALGPVDEEVVVALDLDPLPAHPQQPPHRVGERAASSPAGAGPRSFSGGTSFCRTWRSDTLP